MGLHSNIGKQRSFEVQENGKFVLLRLQSSDDINRLSISTVRALTREIEALAEAGFLFDIPLIALGDGRLKVEQDKPIMLPFDMPAAADAVFDHTILWQWFDYLPTLAST